MPAKKSAAKKPAKKARPAVKAKSSVTEVDENVYDITVAASEKIPTGEYANVDVGPVVASHTVVAKDSDELHEKLTNLCEVVEGVVSEQRELVLESLQDQAQ